MHTMSSPPSIEVFSTAPPSAGMDGSDYLARLIEVARWSEAYGCTGILVYSDNRLVDPWLCAQLIIQNTRALCPLVAVQPAYMHPYTVAKLVTSLACMHDRRTYLNMIAGGFRNDLLALDDDTPHDRRYERLYEYTQLIVELLHGGPASFSGRFYKTHHLELTPSLPPTHMPGIFVSGSSDSGLATARRLGATAIKYPRPAADYMGHAIGGADHAPSGIRVGIITRERESDAWQVACSRFPEDRKGRMTHQLAMKISDSQWHRQLTLLSREAQKGSSVYWLWPFENYKTFCPYLVGSHQAVADELAAYMALGFTTFVLDIPASEQELDHTHRAFELAKERAGRLDATMPPKPTASLQPPGIDPIEQRKQAMYLPPNPRQG